MAIVLAEAGRVPEAESQLRRSLEQNPAHAGARLQLGRLLARKGDSERAVLELRAVVAATPDWTLAQRSLAWVLATAPDGKVRRPEEAVALAERAARDAGEDADALDVLAAAYAAAERYEDAVRVGEQAAERAGKGGSVTTRDAIATRLAAYRARRGWVEP
jgi:tetratricopeptide (TPR) repeat protein